MKTLLATVLAAGSAISPQDQAPAPAAPNKDKPIVLNVVPRACAMGPMVETRPNSSSRADMRVVRPSGNALQGEIVVPAPGCDEGASALRAEAPTGTTVPL